MNALFGQPAGERPPLPAARLSSCDGGRAAAGHAEQCNVRVRRYGHKNVPYGEAAE